MTGSLAVFDGAGGGVKLAKSTIPDPLTRRHLAERELEAGHALKIAEAYLAEGRTVEAVDFLRKANATERLTALREEALLAGDVFLLRAVAGALGSAPTLGEWERVANTAAAAGLDLYAAEARRQAERKSE